MFEVGDKIVCINEPEINTYLKYGNVYTIKCFVKTVSKTYILVLEEITNISFSGYRFEKYNFRREKILKLKKDVQDKL